MNKEEFLSREVTFKADYGITVHRSRNSKDYAAITIIVTGKGKEQRMVFSNESRAFGDNYEMAARELIKTIDNACDEMCLLPEFKK